ncbi:MAG: hypothetical protein K8T89_01950 [Planctomycetes bacterium]|nr:hypothetical protein [Planctomycetota bacterium]
MRRSLWILLCATLSLSCSSDAEKLTVAPLPQEGGTLPFRQVLTRLAAQTDTAKEEHFLNQWDELVNASVSLEQSTKFLLRSPDLPVSHKPQIEKASTTLNTQILKLREAARRKDQTESLESIRLIHNQIRDLQDLK